MTSIILSIVRGQRRFPAEAVECQKDVDSGPIVKMEIPVSFTTLLHTAGTPYTCTVLYVIYMYRQFTHPLHSAHYMYALYYMYM